jgi:hypothetical protein
MHEKGPWGLQHEYELAMLQAITLLAFQVIETYNSPHEEPAFCTNYIYWRAGLWFRNFACHGLTGEQTPLSLDAATLFPPHEKFAETAIDWAMEVGPSLYRQIFEYERWQDSRNVPFEVLAYLREQGECDAELQEYASIEELDLDDDDCTSAGCETHIQNPHACPGFHFVQDPHIMGVRVQAAIRIQAFARMAVTRVRTALQNALIGACYCHDLELVKFLLKEPLVDVNGCGFHVELDRCDPLGAACNCGADANSPADVVKYLVDHGANREGEICSRPLVMACMDGCLPTVKYLLEGAGVELEPADPQTGGYDVRESPIAAAFLDGDSDELAETMPYVEILKLLLAHGARYKHIVLGNCEQDKCVFMKRTGECSKLLQQQFQADETMAALLGTDGEGSSGGAPKRKNRKKKGRGKEEKKGAKKGAVDQAILDPWLPEQTKMEVARKMADEQAKRKAEERVTREADEKMRKKAEKKARREAEKQAKRDVGEQERTQRKEGEERERAVRCQRKEAQATKAEEVEKRTDTEEGQAKKEAEEGQAKKEAAKQAKKKAQERAARLEALSLEAGEKARKKAEKKARRDAEKQAKKGAEEQAKREIEQQAKREVDARAEHERMQRAEVELRAEAAEQEAAEQAREEADEQVRRQAREQEQARRDLVLQQGLGAMGGKAAKQARRAAEEQAKREAAARVKSVFEEQARREVEQARRPEEQTGKVVRRGHAMSSGSSGTESEPEEEPLFGSLQEQVRQLQAQVQQLVARNKTLTQEKEVLVGEKQVLVDEKDELLCKFELLEEMYQPVNTENEKRKTMLSDQRKAALEISRSRLDLDMPTKRMGELDNVQLGQLGLSTEDISLLEKQVVCNSNFHPWRVVCKPGCEEVETVVNWADEDLQAVVQKYDGCSGGRGREVAEEVLRSNNELQQWNPSGGYCVTIPYHHGEQRELLPAELLKLAAGMDVPGCRHAPTRPVFPGSFSSRANTAVSVGSGGISPPYRAAAAGQAGSSWSRVVAQSVR